MVKYSVSQRILKWVEWSTFFFMFMVAIYSCNLGHDLGNPPVDKSKLSYASDYLLVFFLACGVYYSLWYHHRARLVLSADGATFIFPGCECRTTWENIERIQSISSQDCVFILKDKSRVEITRWYGFLSARIPGKRLPFTTFIDWPSTEGYQVLKQYIPQVADEWIAKNMQPGVAKS